MSFEAVTLFTWEEGQKAHFTSVATSHLYWGKQLVSFIISFRRKAIEFVYTPCLYLSYFLAELADRKWKGFDLKYCIFVVVVVVVVLSSVISWRPALF